MANSETTTVLVVDDDIDCAEALSGLLQDLGCKATARHDTRSAIETAVAVLPALVIVDLALGSEDGCLLMNSIRDRLPPGDRPVMVCLTGHADPQTELQCLQRGFDIFLAKPLSPDALHEVLAVVNSLQRKRLPSASSRWRAAM